MEVVPSNSVQLDSAPQKGIPYSLCCSFIYKLDSLTFRHNYPMDAISCSWFLSLSSMRGSMTLESWTQASVVTYFSMSFFEILAKLYKNLRFIYNFSAFYITLRY